MAINQEECYRKAYAYIISLIVDHNDKELKRLAGTAWMCRTDYYGGGCDRESCADCLSTEFSRLVNLIIIA